MDFGLVCKKRAGMSDQLCQAIEISWNIRSFDVVLFQVGIMATFPIDGCRRSMAGIENRLFRKCQNVFP